MKKLTGKRIALLVGDIIILYFSLYLTLLLRYFSLPNKTLWLSHFYPFTVIFFAWILIFYIGHLYELRLATSNIRFWQLSSRAILISALFSAAFFYLNPQVGISPKRNLFIFMVVFSLIFALWRHLYNWSLKTYLPKKNLAIIGLNEQVRELIRELKAKPHLGYRVAFVVADESRAKEKIDDTPIYLSINNLTELIIKNKVSAIILTADPHQSAELRNSLFACLPLKINYIGLPIFYENLTGKVPVSVINQMWFLENLSEGSRATFDLIKRVYDFILALMIFLLTLIFWPLISLVIKLESSGPIFFRQTRLGKNGRPFKIYKFRTMKTLSNDHSPTAADDKRITTFGSLLRKVRLDEIPQMINIMRGEMSFVGPRPERPELIKELEKIIPFYRERMLVKPGITGWDQISGEYHSPSYDDTLKKLQYDLFYIKNRSIYLDLSIVLKTVATVLSRGGR